MTARQASARQGEGLQDADTEGDVSGRRLLVRVCLCGSVEGRRVRENVVSQSERTASKERGTRHALANNTAVVSAEALLSTRRTEHIL